MTASDPLPLRCLALTAMFETSLPFPASFSSISGDWDGQGMSQVRICAYCDSIWEPAFAGERPSMDELRAMRDGTFFTA